MSRWRRRGVPAAEVPAAAGRNGNGSAKFTATAFEAAAAFVADKSVDACVSWAPDIYNIADRVPQTHILSSTKDANKLIADIESCTGLEARATILGHIQRGGTPTPADRVLATMFGHHALDLLLEGAVGKLVVWKDGKLNQEDIESVAGKQRKVPADHPLVHTARAVGTSFGD